MTTPIRNKASEVRAWIERVKSDGGDVGHSDVRSYIEKRWPYLDADVKASIFETAVLG